MKKIIILILSLLLLLCASSFAQKEYDGIWFMGFNMHKDIFDGSSGKLVREAITKTIDRKSISIIMNNAEIPSSIIPPNMQGYSPILKIESPSIKEAKTKMKEAGYSIADKRIKNMILLHTDGIKTIQIAQAIKKDLTNIGMKIELKEISYKNEKEWNKELAGGRHHLFLMGYKGGPLGTLLIGNKKTKIFHLLGCLNTPEPEDQVFFSNYDEAIAQGYSPDREKCNPQKEGEEVDPVALVEPLFYSEGSANFTYYNNPKADKILEQLTGSEKSLKEMREEKLKKLNQIIADDLPVLPLFYITKL